MIRFTYSEALQLSVFASGKSSIARRRERAQVKPYTQTNCGVFDPTNFLVHAAWVEIGGGGRGGGGGGESVASGTRTAFHDGFTERLSRLGRGGLELQ